MTTFLGKRAIASAISLVGLIILVFFLSRLTGDPTDLYLPEDASLEARAQFRAIHGLNDPILMQFFRYMGDVITSYSIHYTKLYEVIPALFVWESPTPGQWALLALV